MTAPYPPPEVRHVPGTQLRVTIRRDLASYPVYELPVLRGGSVETVPVAIVDGALYEPGDWEHPILDLSPSGPLRGHGKLDCEASVRLGGPRGPATPAAVLAALREWDVLADGVWLRSQREAMGLSQAALGERLGLAGNSIARMERGEMAVREVTRRAVLHLSAELHHA